MSTKAIDPFTGKLITIDDIPGLEVLEPVPIGFDTQLFGFLSVTGILHKGMDKSAPQHTPIRAAQDGVCFFRYTFGRDMPGLESDGSPGGYGNQAFLDHGNGITSRYAHMTVVMVQDGQRVSAGDIIGTVGSTGISTGPHLHWELRTNGMAFDPQPYIVESLEPPEEEDELDAEDRAALDWLKANRKALSPYTISAIDAQFDTGHDAPATNDGVSKGIRRLTRLLGKMCSPLVENPTETDDKLIAALSRED